MYPPAEGGPRPLRAVSKHVPPAEGGPRPLRAVSKHVKLLKILFYLHPRGVCALCRPQDVRGPPGGRASTSEDGREHTRPARRAVTKSNKY